MRFTVESADRFGRLLQRRRKIAAFRHCVRDRLYGRLGCGLCIGRTRNAIAYDQKLAVFQFKNRAAVLIAMMVPPAIAHGRKIRR